MDILRNIFSGVRLADKDRLEMDFPSDPYLERDDPSVLIPTALNKAKVPDPSRDINRSRTWNRLVSLPYVWYPSVLGRNVPVAAAFRWNFGGGKNKDLAVDALLSVKKLDTGSGITQKDFDYLIDIASKFLYNDFIVKLDPEIIFYPATSFSPKGKGSSGNPHLLDRMISAFERLHGPGRVLPYSYDIPKTNFYRLFDFMEKKFPEGSAERAEVLKYLNRMEKVASEQGVEPYFQLKSISGLHRQLFENFMDVSSVEDAALEYVMESHCPVAVIDDIWTTGHTIRDISSQLLSLGAGSVSACVIWSKDSHSPDEEYLINYALENGIIDPNRQRRDAPIRR